MVNLKGSKTEQNLQTALEGEALAHTKYEYYASQAKKDGFVQISEIFEETSKNEKEHAEVWFKLLHGGEVPKTLDNLAEAIETENYESTDMYLNFAKTAHLEGFEDIAKLFELTAAIENEHKKRYNILVNNIEKGKVFKKDEMISWKCGNCGNIVYGKVPPETCPMCNHPQGYYRKKEDSYK